jgi:hypothetical protein
MPGLSNPPSVAVAVDRSFAAQDPVGLGSSSCSGAIVILIVRRVMAGRAWAFILGDSERVLYAAQDTETEALDTLVWTPPRTIAGLLALLELWPELRRSRVMDDDQTDTIIGSVIATLDGIHPNARRS